MDLEDIVPSEIKQSQKDCSMPPIHLGSSDSWRQRVNSGRQQPGGRGKEELLFCGYIVSVWPDDFTTMTVCLRPLSCTLKIGYDGQFSVTCVLAQLKKNGLKKF